MPAVTESPFARRRRLAQSTVGETVLPTQGQFYKPPAPGIVQSPEESVLPKQGGLGGVLGNRPLAPGMVQALGQPQAPRLPQIVDPGNPPPNLGAPSPFEGPNIDPRYKEFFGGILGNRQYGSMTPEQREKELRYRINQRIGSATSQGGDVSRFQELLNSLGSPATLGAPVTPPKPKFTVKPTDGIPGLPEGYGFDELAAYEEAKRAKSGDTYQDLINQLRTGIEGQFGTALGDVQSTGATRRAELARSLTDSARQNFELQNPAILEDLNARGVFSSPTAVAQAQAQALKELEVGNQAELRGFDTEQRGLEDELKQARLEAVSGLTGAGTTGKLQALQDALDAALDLRRGKLEGTLADRAASREESLARSLARKQQQGDIISSLIGGAASVFCFDAFTPIEMADGSTKPIHEVDIDDFTRGGLVQAVKVAKTPDGTLFDYLGTTVTGSHAVKENGMWIRVKDSLYSVPLGGSSYVYSITTSEHRVYANGQEFADEVETDAFQEIEMNQYLEMLNREDNLTRVN